MMSRSRNTIFLTLVALLTPFPAVAENETLSFLRDLAPTLMKRCSGCHGEKKNKGDYRLHTFEGLMGPSDDPMIVPGDPEQSMLYQVLIDKDEDVRMPQQDDPLEPQMIEKVREWILAGARYDGGSPKERIKAVLPPREHPLSPKVYRVPTPVFALSFSPDGRELAVGGYHEVTLWNSKTLSLESRLQKLPERIQDLHFLKSGNNLLVGGGSPGEYGELSLIDLKTSSREVIGTFEDVVLALAVDSAEKRVAASAADRYVRVYDLTNGKLLWKSRSHADWVTGLTFSNDDRFVVSSSKDMTVKVHETMTGELFTTYTGHTRQYKAYTGRFRVYDVVFDPKTKSLLSAGEGRAHRVWDAEKARSENGTAADMEKRFSVKGHTQYLDHHFKNTAFKLSARDGHVFSASGDGVVKRHDIASRELVQRYDGGTDWLFALDVHLPSKRVAAGAFNGEVRIWDTETGETTGRFTAAPGSQPDVQVRKAGE